MQEFVTEVGHRIVYTRAGNPGSPPVIMLHGWLSHRGIWQLAEALGFTKFALIGHSLGVQIAVCIASLLAKRPARVTRLVSVGGRLVVIDECGHYPMYEKPRPYLEALQKF